jgi:hypothetical protein
MSCFHCDSVGCGCPDADLRSFEETLRLQGLYQDPEGSTGGGAYEGSAVSGGEPEAVARPTVSVSYGVALPGLPLTLCVCLCLWDHLSKQRQQQ